VVNVLFVINSAYDQVVAVAWEQKGGVMVRKSHPSKAFVDVEMDGVASLREAMITYGGAYSPMYPAVVSDVRSFFKYIGKSPDLVELLPKAELELDGE